MPLRNDPLKKDQGHTQVIYRNAQGRTFSAKIVGPASDVQTGTDVNGAPIMGPAPADQRKLVVRSGKGFIVDNVPAATSVKGTTPSYMHRPY